MTTKQQHVSRFLEASLLRQAEGKLNKEHLALRNNFRVTKKFLTTKFECSKKNADGGGAKIE